MRRRLLLLPLVLACVLAPPASAAPVLVLGPGARVSMRDLPPSLPGDPPPGASRHAARAATDYAPAARGPKRKPKPPELTVRTELLRLYHAHAITLTAYHRYRAGFERALTAVKHLGGTRATELQSVITTLHDIAAAGALDPSRLPELFLTLDRNRQWWTTGPLLSSGQRVTFSGSQILWEYYPGRGIQLQVLGTFGRIDGLFAAGSDSYATARSMLAEMIPLATRRGGGMTWEYDFPFDGGVPPWTSAMSQATAIEALTRAYRAFGDAHYLALAHSALPILHRAPPVGVAVPTAAGTRFLLYSFAPGARVINGFLQTLIGLWDYSQASNDTDAAVLFGDGDAEARLELPGYDLGGWSLYQPGEVDTLDYHQLVTGFAQDLCSRTHVDVYCTTAQHFQADLTTPPALQLITHRTRTGIPTRVSFSVDKPAHVGIVVMNGSQTIISTSADFDGGSASFAIGTPTTPGQYTVRLGATDLAGNFSHIAGTLGVG